MSNDENKDVILRWFDAVNRGDIQLLDRLADEFFTADYVEHDSRKLDFEPGPMSVKKFIHQVLKKNIDLHVTVHDIFSCENKIAYRFSVSMTDAASGKTVNMQNLAITRFVGSQIAEEWELSALGNW
jgi:ketosteroid isomerase-like protein